MKRLEIALSMCEQKEVYELLNSYITEQYANKARVGKFKLTNFCGKNDIRPVMNGIYYIDGFQIATDHYIFAVIKESYIDEWEGKIIHAKTGVVINESYPKYKTIRPCRERGREIELPYIDIKDLTAKYKVAKASEKYDRYRIKLYDVYFNIDVFLRFYPIIDRLKGKAYIYDDTRPLYIENDNDEWALMMPVESKYINNDTFVFECK